MTRVVYAFQLMVWAILAWILSNLPTWTKDNWLLAHIPGLSSCPAEICYGTMAVYRITFALAVFHLLMAAVLLGVKSSRDCRSTLQDGWWFFKLLFVVLITVAAFFIPNAFFVPYGWVALFGAGLFILIQLVLLVDFAHSWNERWVGNYDETQSRVWAGLLLGSTLTMYLISIVGTILMYVFLTGPECGTNTMFITINLILCFVFTIFSIHPRLQDKNPKAGLLQSAVVTLYATYLVWSAIMSEPSDTCKGPFASGSGNGISTFLGVAITIIAVIYSTITAAGSSNSFVGGDEEAQGQEVKSPADAEATEGAEAGTPSTSTSEKSKLINSSAAPEDLDDEDADDEANKTSYSYSFFHLTYAMAAMYLAMLFTNWKTVHDDPTVGIKVDAGLVSVWVKIVSAWLTILIYVWSLLAPVLLPDRFAHLL